MHENTDEYPIIFLVEEDNDVRPSLTKNLRKGGYRVLVSAALEDAFEWLISNSHIHADLMVVNLLRKMPAEALNIGRSLRELAKYDGRTPLIVMPEQVPGDLQGFDERVSDFDWICYYEDGDQLQRLIARLLKKKRIQPFVEPNP